jgi:hypothetical protein
MRTRDPERTLGLVVFGAGLAAAAALLSPLDDKSVFVTIAILVYVIGFAVGWHLRGTRESVSSRRKKP